MSMFSGRHTRRPKGRGLAARKTAAKAALIESLSVALCSMCEQIDSARSLSVHILVREGCWDELLSLEINPLHYLNAHTFADDYLVTKWLSKCDILPTSFNREEAAYAAFKWGEEQCRMTNLRLRSNPESKDEGVQSVIRLARKIIAEVLDGGTVRENDNPWFHPLFIDSFEEKLGWGPGATSAVKGAHVSFYNKLRAKLEGTPGLMTLPISTFVDGVLCWRQNRCAVSTVPGNRVVFVPKNAKTDRAIAIEPHLNSLFQRPVGAWIRRRLRTIGVNLDDATKNQDLCRIGSINGSFATIDLKGASDTLSEGVLELLLPNHWQSLLQALRSPVYQLVKGEGKSESWNRYHKHSSMGNTYTFELESLIFSALTLASIRLTRPDDARFSVFGDDIVVPTSSSDLLIRSLQHAGFTINSEKSFLSGPFRESCGKDYFLGVSVRPCYAKELDGKPIHVSLYKLANGLIRYAHSRCSGLARDGRLFRAWRHLFVTCCPRLRYRIPDGVGDGGFIGCLDECTSQPAVRFENSNRVDHRRPDGYGKRRGWEPAWIYTQVSFKPLKFDRDDPRFAVGSALGELDGFSYESSWTKELGNTEFDL
ncbi:MAG: RNA replicase beta chain, partial [Sanya fiers-like virus 55]